MTVQLFDIWFYIKHNTKQQYKTHQSLSPRKWEGQDGGWAQSAPNTGCAREQASVLLRKSLFGGNPSEGFTDIRRWSHFTETRVHFPRCCRCAAAPRFLVLAWTDRPLLSTLPAQCRPLLGVTRTNHSYTQPTFLQPCVSASPILICTATQSL